MTHGVLFVSGAEVETLTLFPAITSTRISRVLSTKKSSFLSVVKTFTRYMKAQIIMPTNAVRSRSLLNLPLSPATIAKMPFSTQVVRGEKMEWRKDISFFLVGNVKNETLSVVGIISRSRPRNQLQHERRNRGGRVISSLVRLSWAAKNVFSHSRPQKDARKKKTE